MRRSFHPPSVIRPRPWLTPLLLPIYRPILTVVLTAGVLALAAFSASRITPATSLRPMFPEDNPATGAMVRVLDEFRAADSLLLLVDDPRPHISDTQARAHALAFADRLRQAIKDDPAAASRVTTFMDRPGAMVRPFIEQVIVPAGVYYLDEARFKTFKKRLQPAAMRARIQRNQALIATASPTADALTGQILKDPLHLSELLIQTMSDLRPEVAPGASGAGEEGFFGNDRRTLLIQIGATQPAGEIGFTKKFMDVMRQAVARAGPGPLKVAYTGGYPLAELSATVIRRDMIWSVVGSLVLLQLLFWGVYRQPWIFPAMFVPVGGGILAGFGAYAFFSARLTPVTAASGAILAGLGVDYAIHYLAHYHAKRAADCPPLQAAHSALSLAPAMFAACVTSMVGFAAIAFASVPALRDFAWIGALGLAGAFLGTLILLPAILMLVDRPRKNGPSVRGTEGGGSPAPSHVRPPPSDGGRRAHANPPVRIRFNPLMRWVDRHRRLCLATTLALAAISVVIVAVMGFIGFSADLGELNPQPNPPLRVQDRMGRLFPGAMRAVQVYMEADNPEALVRKAHAVDNALGRSALVRDGRVRVFSVASLLPDPAMVAHRKAQLRTIDADKVIADFRAAVADSDFNPRAYDAYADFLHQLLTDPHVPTLRNLTAYPALAGMLLPRSAFGDHPEPVTQTLAMVGLSRTITTASQQRAIDQQVRKAIAPIPHATATGVEIIANDMQIETRKELAWLLSIAAGVVMVWLFITFRSPTRVALTLIPAAFAAVVLAAVMRLCDQNLNLVNVIAMPLLAGIGVDDGIFMVSIATSRNHKPKAQRSKSKAPGGKNNVRDELAASAHAITVTSLTTVIGFGSLGLTSTPAIRSLGLVLGVGMIACWVSSVFMLGPILLTHAGGPTPASPGRDPG